MPIFKTETTGSELIPLVGREKELGLLKEQLELIERGSGARVVLISGEAGIGKTRFAKEAVNIAQKMGFRTLEGKCLHESLTPYLPIFEALRDAELGHLISFERPPRVDYILLMNSAGVPLIKIERETSELDMDIFSGMLSAVSTFVKESMDKFTKGKAIETGLNVMGYGDHRILLETGQLCTLVIILTGQETEILNDDMGHALNRIENANEQLLREWDGDAKKTEPMRSMLEPFLDKYDGLDYVTDPKNKQWRLFENISKGLKRIIRKQPVLLFIDDLQWSDPSGLTLLNSMMRSCIKDRMIILGTYRPEELEDKEAKEHPLLSFRRSMEREGSISEIKLHRFEDSTTESLLVNEMGDLGHGPLGKLIIKESQGNPFFALEIVTFLRNDGTIVLVDKHWRLTRPIEKIGLPEKVKDAVIARLKQLSQDQKDILECASVVGEIFRSDTIGCVLETNRLRLLKSLNEIERRHRLVCEIKGHNKYKFDHTIIREILYSEIPNELKIEYHKTIFNCYKRAFDEGIKDVLPELAVHAYLAKQSEAVKYCRLAGDLAKAQFNNDEARRCYDMALSSCKDEERNDILTTLGEIEYQAGNNQCAASRFSKVLENTKDLSVRIELSLKIARALEVQGKLQEAMDILGTIPQGSKGTVIYARLLATKAWMLLRLMRYSDAIKLGQESLDIFKGSGGSPDDISDVLNTIGSCYKESSNRTEAEKFYQDGIDISKEGKAWYQAGRLSYNLGKLYSEIGLFDKGLEYGKYALEISERIGNSMLRIVYTILIGTVRYNLGQWAEAEDILTDAISKAKEKELSIWSAVALNCRALVRLNLGKIDDALSDTREALKIAHEVKGAVEVDVQLDTSLILIVCDQSAEAEIVLQKAICATGDNKEFYYHGQRNLAILLVRKGKRTEADRIFTIFEKEAKDILSSIEYSRGLRWWGEALIKWGEKENAKEKLEKAKKIDQEIGALGELALVEKLLKE